MRKNLIPHKDLIQANKATALQYFQKAYGISPAEAETITGGTLYGRLFRATSLIYGKALEAGMRKCDALAQTTSANIAALATDWEDPEHDVRRAGRTLSRFYGPRKGSEITAISLLRQDVVRAEYDIGFQLNAIGDNDNGETHYSYIDQLDGLRALPVLGTDKMFLMGVYRADGNPVNFKKHVFRLSGKTSDERFYRDILEPMIEASTNHKVTTRVVPRQRETSTWTEITINIGTERHLEYLMDDIGLFNRAKQFFPLDVERLGENSNDIHEYYLAYLMGMIAAGGHMKEKDGNLVLEFNNRARRLVVPEVQRVIKTRQLPFAYSMPKPTRMHFSQSELETMLEQEAPRITDSQRGLFVNPTHVDILTANFI